MNKHLETLIGFKEGTKRTYKNAFYDLWDAWDEIASAFKKIGIVIFNLVIWVLVLIFIIPALPLVTWYRLKCDQEYEDAINKAKNDYMDHMTSLHQEGGDHD